MVRLSTLDWIIVASILAVSLSIGILVSKRAGANSDSFFLSGRSMPWWLLGTSMVATTFSTDTPNLVAEIVRTNGVSGNWIWWAFLITGMFTAFLYARLWRRSGAMTDLEFYELRYSGKAAAFLRGFRALYLGVFFNIMTMALVSLAAIKIAAVMLGFSPVQTLLIAGTVTLLFSALGGFLGVVLTDLILFAISMTGAILAASVALGLPEVNGLQNLLTHPSVVTKLSFLPDFSNMEMALAVFIIPYRGSVVERLVPGFRTRWWRLRRTTNARCAQRTRCGWRRGVISDRTLCDPAMALDPGRARLAHCVPGPGFDSAAFPHVESQLIGHDMAYPAMLTFLPAGLLGLVFASLIAAYMSTMSSQVNWGSSYVVHDFYKRFVNPEASEQATGHRWPRVDCRPDDCGRPVRAMLWKARSRHSISCCRSAPEPGFCSCCAGSGGASTPTSEVVAMAVSFLAALYFQFADLPDWSPYLKLISGIGVTTAAWILAACLGPKTDAAVLEKFCSELRAARARLGCRQEAPAGSNRSRCGQHSARAAQCLRGLPVSVYALLFGTGYTIYGQYGLAAGLLLSGSVGIGFLVKSIRRTKLV